MKEILAVQSFIMGSAESYWDYRDYIFSLCSSRFLLDQVVRLNVERGGEWVQELGMAAKKNNFVDCLITEQKPKSWAGYMVEQIEKNPTKWVFPFPGDHIYIEKDNLLLPRFLKYAEEHNIDAVNYGHIQDWEYLLDWNRIKIIENNKDFVVIEWGNKYRFCKNYPLIKSAVKVIGKYMTMPPVPGFMLFRSKFFKDVMESIPQSKRWQDMEYSTCKSAWSYRILIPKSYLFRHVHGYWLEYFFDVMSGRKKLLSSDREALQTMYIKSNYNWETDTPTNFDYGLQCASNSFLMNKYLGFSDPDDALFINSPFNKKFVLTSNIFVYLFNFMKLYFIDNLKRLAGPVLKFIKS